MSKNKNNNSKGCSFIAISLLLLIGIIANIDFSKRYTFIIILIAVLVAIFLYFFITALINNSSKKKEIEKLISKERDERRKLFLTGLALKYNKESDKEICINTELSDSQREAYKILYLAFEELCTCDKTWFIVSRTANNEDKSSASFNVNRRIVTFTKSTFNKVFVPDTHFVPTLNDGINTKYYIYPTCIVKAKGEKDFEIINFVDVKVKFATQDFVEDTYEFNQPNDSKIIRYTYRKVNKDGSPDLRFNNNKKLPVYEYGKIKIDRLGITFMTSNVDKTRAFVSAFADYKAAIANTQKQTMSEDKTISKEISDRINNEEPKETQNDSEESNKISNIENIQHGIKELESQIIAVVKLLLQNNHVSQRYLSEKTGINISLINTIDGYLFKMGITDSSGKLLIHSESDLIDILKKVNGDQFYFQKRELTMTNENISEIKRLINKTKDEKYLLFYQGHLLSEEKKRNSILNQLGIPNTDEISITKPINGRIENECIIIDSNLSQEECTLFRRFCESSNNINDVYSIENEIHLNSSPVFSSEIKRDFAMFSTLYFNNILQSECFIDRGVPNIYIHSTNLFFYCDYVVMAKSQVEFSIIPIDTLKMNYYPITIIENKSDEKEEVIAPEKVSLVSSSNSNGIMCEYGIIEIQSLGFTFMVENVKAAKDFVESFNNYQEGMVNRKNKVEPMDTITNINIFGVTKEYYDSVNKTTNALISLYKSLLKDNTIMDKVDHCVPIGDNPKNKLMTLFFSDIMKLYQVFGYNHQNVINKEGLPLIILFMNAVKGEQLIPITYENLNLLLMFEKSVPKAFDSIKDIFTNYPDEDFFFIPYVLSLCNREDLKIKYFTSLYRLFSIISKVDNIITDKEQKWLDNLMKFTVDSQKVDSGELDIKENKTVKSNIINSTTSKDKADKNPIDELNELIGLDNVKTEVSNLANLVKVQKMREGRGMKTSPISYHCVFTGNPGTGKTTVARIIAEVYKELGVLKKGHLVETDRSGLVAEYVGQTATKTNKIIDSALDGVLFIDEAYSLIQGSQNDYGNEAISTLLKRMEDDRERLVVILAGYSKEMEVFINSNSGLQSRFNRYIEFPDYSCQELVQIFDFIIKKNEFVLTEEASQRIKEVIAMALENKDKNFGNARYIRNLFEKIITQQANRITSSQIVTNEVLSTIEEVDIIKAAK